MDLKFFLIERQNLHFRICKINKCLVLQFKYISSIHVLKYEFLVF